MSPKEHFLSKEFSAGQKLSGWWAGVVHDQRFEDVITFVRSQFLESGYKGAELDGAKHFEGILRTISDNTVGNIPMPSPGIDHDIDDPGSERERAETAEKKPKKKKQPTT